MAIGLCLVVHLVVHDGHLQQDGLLDCDPGFDIPMEVVLMVKHMVMIEMSDRATVVQ